MADDYFDPYDDEDDDDFLAMREFVQNEYEKLLQFCEGRKPHIDPALWEKFSAAASALYKATGQVPRFKLDPMMSDATMSVLTEGVSLDKAQLQGFCAALSDVTNFDIVPKTDSNKVSLGVVVNDTCFYTLAPGEEMPPDLMPPEEPEFG